MGDSEDLPKRDEQGQTGKATVIVKMEEAVANRFLGKGGEKEFMYIGAAKAMVRSHYYTRVCYVCAARHAEEEGCRDRPERCAWCGQVEHQQRNCTMRSLPASQRSCGHCGGKGHGSIEYMKCDAGKVAREAAASQIGAARPNEAGEPHHHDRPPWEEREERVKGGSRRDGGRGPTREH